MIARSLVRLRVGALPGNNLGQVVYTHVSLFAKQYNLVLVKGQWHGVARKVTMGLASHWPCVTDSVVYLPVGSTTIEGETSTLPTLFLGYSTFIFTYFLCRGRVWMLFFMRESSYCFSTSQPSQFCPSVCLSITLMDQSKMVQARIIKYSPSAAWKTLVLGTVKLFHKFKGGHPERGC